MLVVDDDANVREVAASALAAAGHTVTQASGGVEALAAIADAVPDLVVLDYAMPGMTGGEAARIIARDYPGLPVIFIDTAGLREARDEIEVEGIRRSRESLAAAEFILHVLDASEPLTSADEIYLKEFADKKRILVCNKTDLPKKLELPLITHHSPLITVSSLSGQGIETLKDAIKTLVWAGEIKAEMLQVAINSRHQDALNRARFTARQATDALRDGMTLELVAMDLRIAANAVGEIVGKTTTEDLLDSIFSAFCIGK